MGLLPKMTVLVAMLLIAFLGGFSVVRSDPNTNVTNVLCNGDVYANDDPFAISLAYVVAELESVTSSRQGYDSRNISPYPNAFAYGHAACNQNLTSSDCTTCLGAAKTAMFSSCDNRIGARSVLVDCTISTAACKFEMLALARCIQGCLEVYFTMVSDKENQPSKSALHSKSCEASQCVVRSDPNTNVMMVMCNPNVYANDDPFTNSLAYVIAELETVTPNRQGYDLRNVSPYPTSLAYGHASCNQNLAASDCTLCLVAAKTTMSSYCNNRIGARSVLADCLIRYEQYSFDD
ncbi:hypothetical protein RJ640_019781 [Escallonia rubra]|uniref:Gnk2-homologous domain-containing protein n=1 Tax=Escallonia rubra TaxID=112253 RepID=A0AA88RVQ6_9ASTE|nr:hypothetical protein RJ640_019781 [Escallonia rubra]